MESEQEGIPNAREKLYVQQDIDNYKVSNLIPIHLFSITATLLLRYNKKIRDDRAATRSDRQLYRRHLAKFSQACQLPDFLPDNVMNYAQRLMRHYNKYKGYQTKFVALMNSSSFNSLGYLLSAPDKMIKKANIQLKVPRTTTSQSQIESWISSGNYVKFIEEIDVVARYMSDFETLNPRNIQELEEADKLRKLINFARYTYTSADDALPLSSSISQGYSWLINWSKYLPRRTGLLVDASLHQRSTLKLIYCNLHVTQNRRTQRYSLPIYFDSPLALALCKTGYETITITPRSLETPLEAKPLDADEWIKSVSNLLLCSQVAILDKLAILPTSQIIVTPSKVKVPVENYMKITSDGYRAIPAGKIRKVVFVASKAEGKTTLTNVLKMLPDAKLRFIEDSDDYGVFISYLVNLLDQPNVPMLDKTLTQRDVIRHVVDFCENIDNMRDTFRSHFNIVMEGIIAHDQELSPYKTAIKYHAHALPTLIESTTEQISNYMIHFSQFKNLSQKTFEDGIYTYMQSKGMTDYLALLHIAEDNIRRRPANVMYRILSGNNSDFNQAMRAMSKNYSSLTYLADVALKAFYDSCSEYTMRTITTNQALQVFGAVPIFRSDGRVELASTYELEEHSQLLTPTAGSTATS